MDFYWSTNKKKYSAILALLFNYSTAEKNNAKWKIYKRTKLQSLLNFSSAAGCATSVFNSIMNIFINISHRKHTPYAYE